MQKVTKVKETIEERSSPYRRRSILEAKRSDSVFPKGAPAGKGAAERTHSEARVVHGVSRSSTPHEPRSPIFSGASKGKTLRNHLRS